MLYNILTMTKKTYYRGINKLDKHIDIKEQYSIHITLDIDDIAYSYLDEDTIENIDSREELIEKINELAIEDYLEYKDGHSGEALYYLGVCAVDSREAVEDYFNSICFDLDDLEIIEFQGVLLTDGYDCSIVRPL